LPGSLDKTSGTGFIRAKTLASLTTDTNQEGAINQRLGLFPRILRETILILIISFAAGLVFNWFRPDRLSLVSDWTVEGQLKARFGEKAVISFEEARQAFISKNGVFLDARPANEFQAGHIQGARNIPVDAFDRHFGKATADLSLDSVLITYCDGEACTLSIKLAKKLKEMGYENIRILVNGWSLWRKHHLPEAEG
jgi:rhodanese-related sulfurtransferase